MGEDCFSRSSDLSHHLSMVAQRRPISGLDKMQKAEYSTRGIIDLSVGHPDPTYFPFISVSSEIKDLAEMGLATSLTNGTAKKMDEAAILVRNSPGENLAGFNLEALLQYGPIGGTKLFQKFAREFTKLIYRPARSDWSVLAHTGSTEGLHRVIRVLCDPGDYILLEELAYAPFLAELAASGLKPVGIKMDAEGMSAIQLEQILSSWGTDAKRPHVLYTIPIGNNPSGITMSLGRKQAIYRICKKYDIMIIEDDPYYCLQYGVYHPPSNQGVNGQNVLPSFEDSFKLSPSFLSLDTEGRVIRLDTFSKIMAPGARLGWFTCSTLFALHLEREADTTIAQPSGFSEAIITGLLTKWWNEKKYFSFLRQLQSQYALRRNCLLDCIYNEFHVLPSSAPNEKNHVLTAYTKPCGVAEGWSPSSTARPLFSFVAPMAGFYLWIRLHVQRPGFPPEAIEERIADQLADEKLMVVSGKGFMADDNAVAFHSPAIRLAFSRASIASLSEGVRILKKVLSNYEQESFGAL